MPKESPATSAGQELLGGRYAILKTIGEGNFAKVKLGEHLPTGTAVAIKMIDLRRYGNVYEFLLRESRCMKRLQHPNIVQLYEVIETKTSLIMVMEYVGGGDMMEYLELHGRMTEEEARRIFRQVLSAISYCHQCGIAHRDIKPGNIFFDTNMNIKVGDFGFGREFTNSKLSTICCTPNYAAPEVLMGEEYEGPAVDAWSLGVTLYRMVAGTLPFKAEEYKELELEVTKGEYIIPKFFSVELESLLKKLLTGKPQERGNLKDLMSDPWLNKDEEEDLMMYREPHNKIIDPWVLREMSNLGFHYDEIQDMLSNDRCNQVRAAYLILKRKRPEFSGRSYNSTTESPAPAPEVQPGCSTYQQAEQHDNNFKLGQKGKQPAGPSAHQYLRTTAPRLSVESSSITPESSTDLSTIACGRTREPSTITHGPSPGPSTITQGPSMEPSTIMAEPNTEPSTLTDGLSVESRTIISGPSMEPSTTTPGPSTEPSTIIPGPIPEPSNITYGLSVESSTIIPGPSVEPKTITHGLSMEPRTSTPGPSKEHSTITPGPRVESKTIISGPSAESRTIIPGPSTEPNTITHGPSMESSTIILGPRVEPSNIILRPSLEPITITHGPSVESSTIIPGPRVEPSNIIPGPSLESITIKNGHSMESRTIVPGPSVEPRTITPGHSTEPSTITSGPSVESRKVISGDSTDPSTITSASRESRPVKKTFRLRRKRHAIAPVQSTSSEESFENYQPSTHSTITHGQILEPSTITSASPGFRPSKNRGWIWWRPVIAPGLQSTSSEDSYKRNNFSTPSSTETSEECRDGSRRVASGCCNCLTYFCCMLWKKGKSKKKEVPPLQMQTPNAGLQY